MVAVRPTHKLSNPEATGYCEKVDRAIRGARLNRFYPDAKKTRSHLRAMSPTVHRGIYEDLELDLESGLPTYKIWARVQADVTLAEQQRETLGGREGLMAKAKQHPDTVHERQLAKWDYYNTLVLDHELAVLGDVFVKVRRLEESHGFFQIVLDKFDVNGLFLRYLIEVSQRSLTNERLIDVSDALEIAEHTEALRGLVYKFAGVSSENTFAKLSSISGIKVERVNKGTIGPIYFPWSRNVPEKLIPIVKRFGYVASFSIDNAAVDIELDCCNDPFQDLGLVETRRRFGFRVFRDRKFVVPREAVSQMRQILGDAKCIIYSV